MDLLASEVTSLVRKLLNDTNRLVSEVQTISITATGGTFIYTFRGASTAAQAYNVSLANFQAAIRALVTIGDPNATVTGTPGTSLVVTFNNALAGINLPLATLNVSALTGGSATIAKTTSGDGGNVHTDAYLMQFLQTAQETLQGEMAESGIRVNRAKATITVPANTTAIGYTTSPALPDDLLVPHKLYERPTGSTEKFVPLEKYDGDLPDIDALTYLGSWDWSNNEIALIGATRSMDLRISYEKELPRLYSPLQSVNIRGAKEALAYLTAALASRARGNVKVATDMIGGYEDQKSRLINRHLRPDQQILRQRLPYSARMGYRVP